MTADNIGDLFGMLGIGLASIPAYKATALIYKIRRYALDLRKLIPESERDLRKLLDLQIQYLLSKRDTWSAVDTTCLAGSIVSGFLSSLIPFISSVPK